MCCGFLLNSADSSCFYWRISLCTSQWNPIWEEIIITRLDLDIRLLTLIVSWLNKIWCYFFSFSDTIMQWNTNSYANSDINRKIPFFWLLMTSIRWKIVGDWIDFVWRCKDGQSTIPGSNEKWNCLYKGIKRFRLVLKYL